MKKPKNLSHVRFQKSLSSMTPKDLIEMLDVSKNDPYAVILATAEMVKRLYVSSVGYRTYKDEKE